MKTKYILTTIIIFIIAVLVMWGTYIAINPPANVAVIFKKIITTIKPEYRPGFHHLVRVEVRVRDDIQSPQERIVEVIFNNHTLALRPADPAGRRGRTHFQLPEGKYTLKWTVTNNKYIWPRNHTHRRTVEISENDRWITITITGNDVLISPQYSQNK